MRKWQYLSSWATNHKTKGTFPSQTLKVEEKKVALLYWLLAQETRYGHFFFWSSGSGVRTIVKGRNCQYPGPSAINDKNKDTLLSQTLTVEEKKVSLYFYLWPRGQDIGIFFLWRWYVLYFLSFKRWNGHISVPGPQIKEIRTLSFLQLSKFEKAKCPCFYHLLPRVQDIDSFSPWQWYILHFLSFIR